MRLSLHVSKPFIGIVRWLAATLVLAVLVHLAFVVLYPGTLISLLRKRVTGKVGVNRFYHASAPDAEAREVVRPSPDLLYSIGAFDLSKGPLTISSPCGEAYMSLSFYTSAGDNFFVANDRMCSNGLMTVVLTGRGTDLKPDSGGWAVRSPSTTGVMLLRYFAGTSATRAAADRLRREARCRPAL